ncbi:MAG TPA: hypothetical protein VK659_09335 [Asanoa sp.]|nr:hypothetical protein [Asanoa sp.]
MRTSRITLAAAAALLAFTLAACGSDEPTTSTPGGSGGPAATAPAGDDAATAPAGGDCGSAADDIKSVIASTAVDKIDIVGQCTLVRIATTLGEGDKAPAKEICEAAAKVAYTGDINSIRVSSAAGTELSQGISGAPCIG